MARIFGPITHGPQRRFPTRPLLGHRPHRRRRHGEVTQPQPVLPIKFEDQVVGAIQIFPEKLHAAAMKGRYAGWRQSVQGEPRVAALWADVDAIFTVSHVVSQLVPVKMTDGDLNFLP